MTNKLFKSVALFLLASFCIAGLASAQSPSLDLMIEMQGFPITETIKKNKVTFKKSCKTFGRYLSGNKGLWGTGPFQKFNCVARSLPPQKAGEKKSQWILKIYGDNATKNFEIFWRDARGREVSQASYSLRTEVGPIALMSNPKTNALIAFYLSQSLPFRSAIVATGGSINEAIISGSVGKLKNITPATELDVFSMSRVDDIWQITLIGRAEFQGESNKKLEWRVADVDPADQLAPGQFYLFQQFKGREENLRRVDQLIKDQVANFFEKFLNFGRSAYIGGRYGIPLFGQGILKKAPLIGLFGEFRSGIFSGLKMNYDFIPDQKFSDATGSSKLSWSRFQVGYSFSKALSNKFINSIDATPRLGFSSLQFSFDPASVAEQGDAYAFKLQRAPTIGFEAGAENVTNLLRLRAWAFASFSVGILPLDRNHSTTSYRLGIDAYREFVSFKTVKLAVLGFTAMESTSIEKKLTDAEIAAQSVVPRNIQFSSIYLGGGLTLTW